MAITELEDGKEIDLLIGSEDPDFQGRFEALSWLQDQDTTKALHTIGKLFRLVINHLKETYPLTRSKEEQPQLLEEMCHEMAIVGEAARKLDRLMTLFHAIPLGSVTELPEYRELQFFYRTKLAKEVTSPKLPANPLEKLERLAADLDYELFYLLDAQGRPFVTPKVKEQIQLACDFDSATGSDLKRDPLVQVQMWKDRFLQRAAAHIASHTQEVYEEFLKESHEEADNPLTVSLQAANVALIFAANSVNRLIHSPVRASYQYFGDFIYYLRQALNSSEYRKMVASAPYRLQQHERVALTLIHLLCYHLHVHVGDLQEPLRVVQEAVSSHPLQGELMSQWLKQDAQSLENALKVHPHGPFFQVVDLLRIGEEVAFDTMNLGNVPWQIGTLYFGNNRIKLLRLPTPVRQTQIDQASITDEFQGFLRSLEGQASMLLVNFNDPANWKEYARAAALESLEELFPNTLCVTTLVKDSDFYHQSGPYEKEGRSDLFLTSLRDNLSGSNAELILSPKIDRQLFSTFIEELTFALHHLFFKRKKRLTRQERLDFIELTQLFITFKLIDLLEPGILSLSCKDGVDVGMAATAALIAAVGLLRGDRFTQKDRHLFWSLLFVPALLHRERCLQKDKLDRLIHMLHRMEQGLYVLEERGQRRLLQEELGPLFKSDLSHLVWRAEELS
jgi:hypothetical protein